jgi:hypothetical protein
MKSEKELKARLDHLNVVLSDEFEGYIPMVKKIELKRERYYLEEVLEVKHAGEFAQ